MGVASRGGQLSDSYPALRQGTHLSLRKTQGSVVCHCQRSTDKLQQCQCQSSDVTQTTDAVKQNPEVLGTRLVIHPQPDVLAVRACQLDRKVAFPQRA